jgi:general L-amino acid transport system substrate-binding protein
MTGMLKTGTPPKLGAFLSFSFLLMTAQAHAASPYRMCAFRDGPTGPCTCRSESDGPGQFTPVAKSRCRPADSTKKQEKAGAAPAPASEPSASRPAPEPAAAAPPSNAPAATDSTSPAPTGFLPAPAAVPLATPATPPAASAQRKLDEVKARGTLNCGVNTGLLGFSAQTSGGTWAGLDVDFCRAVAAAVLGDGGKVNFVPLETNERFDALQSGKVDILSRNTTWTMDREVGLGFRFAGVLYLDGQGFMIGDEHGLVSAQQLSGTKVCVEAGTTSEKNMAYYFKAQQIEAEAKVFPTREATLKAYLDGGCDAITGDRSSLFSDRAALPEPAKHEILPEVISKEPLGPVVLKADDEWADIVRWTLAGLINAEEVGLDKASATASQPLSDDAQRLVDGAGASGEKLRLDKNWLRTVVAAVGNYNEMFEANVGKASPLGMPRGINALWKRGGILYAPPMW